MGPGAATRRCATSTRAVPRLIAGARVEDFTLYRITLRNAANMHVGVEATDGFTAWGVKIKTPQDRAQHRRHRSDRVDATSPSRTSYINTGDDNVAIKARQPGAART